MFRIRTPLPSHEPPQPRDPKSRGRFRASIPGGMTRKFEDPLAKPHPFGPTAGAGQQDRRAFSHTPAARHAPLIGLFCFWTTFSPTTVATRIWKNIPDLGEAINATAYEPRGTGVDSMRDVPVARIQPAWVELRIGFQITSFIQFIFRPKRSPRLRHRCSWCRSRKLYRWPLPNCPEAVPAMRHSEVGPKCFERSRTVSFRLQLWR